MIIIIIVIIEINNDNNNNNNNNNNNDNNSNINNTVEIIPFDVEIIKNYHNNSFNYFYNYFFYCYIIFFFFLQIPGIRTALYSRLGAQTKVLTFLYVIFVILPYDINKYNYAHLIDKYNCF